MLSYPAHVTNELAFDVAIKKGSKGYEVCARTRSLPKKDFIRLAS